MQSATLAMATVKFRKEVYAQYAGRCGMCGEGLVEQGNRWLELTTQANRLGLDPSLLYNHNPIRIELHRIVPEQNGGKYVLKNVMPVHSHCHKAFHRINPVEAKISKTKIITK